MPRLRYIEESEKTPYTRELIESAKRTGAPDPRVVSLMTRGKLGIAWVEYWNKLLYQGVLPHKLKEMCRIKISVAHQCGYCSTASAGRGPSRTSRTRSSRLLWGAAARRIAGSHKIIGKRRLASLRVARNRNAGW